MSNDEAEVTIRIRDGSGVKLVQVSRQSPKAADAFHDAMTEAASSVLGYPVMLVRAYAPETPDAAKPKRGKRITESQS